MMKYSIDNMRILIQSLMQILMKNDEIIHIVQSKI